MAITNHEVFKAPDNLDVPIWRYMDFTKFVSMLIRKGLFFSRLDKLGDPFEGSLPKINARENLFEELALVTFQSSDAEGLRASHKQIRDLVRDFRPWVSVSTWHMSEHESAAMWKVYARTEEAICIRSTYAKLSTLLPDDVFVGQVVYIDYDKQSLPINNFLWPYVHKRKSFEHERELRALIADFSYLKKQPRPAPPVIGLWRNVDLITLI